MDDLMVHKVKGVQETLYFAGAEANVPAALLRPTEHIRPEAGPSAQL